MRGKVLDAIRLLFAIGLWVIVVSILWVALLGVVDPPVTWHMAGRSETHGPIERTNVRLSAISRSLPLALIASEDQQFMEHHGFAWEAMRKAMERNKKGRRVKGASTISQQTVKNVFLWHGRSYFRKGLEAWFTVLIEVFWTKLRILEVYLNTAEMGKGIFGAEAAAQHCFHRPAKKLTASQSALITATLPNPVKYACARPGPYIKGRQQWTLGQMRNIGDVLDTKVRKERSKEALKKRT